MSNEPFCITAKIHGCPVGNTCLRAPEEERTFGLWIPYLARKDGPCDNYLHSGNEHFFLPSKVPNVTGPTRMVWAARDSRGVLYMDVNGHLVDTYSLARHFEDRETCIAWIKTLESGVDQLVLKV